MDRHLTLARESARSVACRVVGDGPPLVLLNGYGGTAADWDPTFVAALADHRTVYCLDNAGMGASTSATHDHPLTIDSMAEDTIALIQAESLDAIALAGWSMGGFVAQRVAQLVPGAVRLLALVATDPGGRDAVRAPATVWRQLTDDAGTTTDQARRLLNLLFPAEFVATLPVEIVDLVAAARSQLDPIALAAQARAIVDWHHRALAPIVNPPQTLVFHGALDAVIPVVNARLVAMRWRSDQVTVFSDAGHAVMAQYPVEIARAIVTAGDRTRLRV